MDETSGLSGLRARSLVATVAHLLTVKTGSQSQNANLVLRISEDFINLSELEGCHKTADPYRLHEAMRDGVPGAGCPMDTFMHIDKKMMQQASAKTGCDNERK